MIEGGPNMNENGLLVYWDAGNPESSYTGSVQWYDIVGSYDGTKTNNPYYSDGYYTFLGDTDYGRFYHDVIEIDSGSEWTVSMWLKYPNVQTSWRHFCGRNLANNGYWMWHNYGRLSFYQDYYDGGGGAETWGCGIGARSDNFPQWLGNEIPFNKWFNTTITYNATEQSASVYINGNELVASRSFDWSPRPITTTKFTYVCGVGGGNPRMNGYAATYALWNRRLSEHEIITNYNSLRNRFKSDFPFNGLVGLIEPGDRVCNKLVDGKMTDLQSGAEGYFSGSVVTGSEYIDFDGTNDCRAAFGDVSDFDFGTDDFTALIVMDTTGSETYNYFMGKGSLGGNTGWGFFVLGSNGKMYFQTRNEGDAEGINGDDAINDGQTRVFVGKREDGVMYQYIDDVLQQMSSSTSVKDISTTEHFALGERDNDSGTSWGYPGQMRFYYAAIWNRALTDSELETNYNILKNRFDL